MIVALILIICLFGAMLYYMRRTEKDTKSGYRFQHVGDGLREMQSNFKKYAFMTPELLTQTEQDDLLPAVLFNLWGKMKEDQSDAKTVLSSLSTERRYIYALYRVTGDLRQDGVAAFLKGNDTCYLKDAEEILDILDAGEAAELLRNLDVKIGEEPYLEAFDALDIKSRMTDYIRENAEAFMDMEEVEA